MQAYLKVELCKLVVVVKHVAYREAPLGTYAWVAVNGERVKDCTG
jgi:hypothetical protein